MDWFTIEEVSRKRQEIATIIEELAQDNLRVSSQLLPSINFTASAPLTRSRRRQPCYKESLTEDDDDLGKDAEDDMSFAAAGFYGERSGLRSQRRAATVDITDDREATERYKDHITDDREATERYKDHRDIVEDNDSRQRRRERDIRGQRRGEKVGRFWKSCSIL